MHAQTAATQTTSKAKKVIQPRRDWVRPYCRYEIALILEIDVFIHIMLQIFLVFKSRFKFFFLIGRDLSDPRS